VIKTCKTCGITGIDGAEFRKKVGHCRQCEKERTRQRMAAYRKTEGYKKWLEDSRENRKNLKEKYRRQQGSMTIDEIKQRSEENKKAKDAAKEQKARILASLHDAHVQAMRSLTDAQRQSRKYHNDPKHCIYHRVKRWMHKHLDRSIPSKKWGQVLGYTPDKLRQHIERQFTKGMGWHNKGEWHIDHIIPVAAFWFETEHDDGFRQAYALSNLRPIWAKDNLRKRDSIEFLL